MEQIKKYKRQIVLGSVIFLTASLSFGLGYLADHDFNRTPIIIERCSDISGAKK